LAPVSRATDSWRGN